MDVFRIDPVGEPLGDFHVRNLKEGIIIIHAEGIILCPQFVGKEVVSVHIEKLTERSHKWGHEDSKG